MSNTDVVVTKPLVLVPNLMNPEVVPGGYLQDAQWRKVQDALNDLAGAITNINVTVNVDFPTSYRGEADIAFPSGGAEDPATHTIAPNISYLALNWGAHAEANYATLQIILPARKDAIGPIQIVAGRDTWFQVVVATGDDMIEPDVQDGTAPAIITTRKCGTTGGDQGCIVVATPMTGSTTRWLVYQMSFGYVG